MHDVYRKKKHDKNEYDHKKQSSWEVTAATFLSTFWCLFIEVEVVVFGLQDVSLSV